MTITSNCDLSVEQYIPKMKLGIKFPSPQIISQVKANHLGVFQEVSHPASAGWVGVTAY
jgi:hypothetical protein